MAGNTKAGKIDFLLQQGSNTREANLFRHEAMLCDVRLQQSTLDGLVLHEKALRLGALLPVGSVAFVETAMRLSGIPLPPNLSYPPSIHHWLKRAVKQQAVADVCGRCFIKPLATKAFTGVVIDFSENPEHLSFHDRAQYNAFQAMAPDQLVWISEPVTWASEFRYYVLEGKILGAGRYDDGPDEAPCPAPFDVLTMVREYVASGEAPAAFCLDAGVLDTGITALVEVNDAWAVGYYSGTLTRENYIRMLTARWLELVADHSTTAR